MTEAMTRVTVVGAGMCGEVTLTREGAEAVGEAEILIGSERVTRAFARLGKPVFHAYMPDDITAVIKKEKPRTAAVMMSGDIGFFSGAKKLIAALESDGGFDVRAVCGVSSAAYMCARAGVSYEDMKFISLHGRQGNAAVNVRLNEKCFFLLGGDMTAAGVCRLLCEYGLSGTNVHVGENLGCQDEKLYSGKADEFTDLCTSRLSVMIVQNPDYLPYLPSCIADSEFIRTKIPMTKAAVRGFSAAGLSIGKTAVVWDIGCGTGSVSVEAAFRCPDGVVYAFDKDPEAVSLTLENARRFGCDNIKALVCEMPALPEGIRAPNSVFIGGAGGQLGEIVDLVLRMSPAAAVTVTAVTLETLEEARAAFAAHGRPCTATMLSVTDTRRLGSHTLLQAQNPVFVLTGPHRTGLDVTSL